MWHALLGDRARLPSQFPPAKPEKKFASGLEPKNWFCLISAKFSTFKPRVMKDFPADKPFRKQASARRMQPARPAKQQRSGFGGRLCHHARFECAGGPQPFFGATASSSPSAAFRRTEASWMLVPATSGPRSLSKT
ncbi:MAG TPA: hypothetical protein VFV96_05590 [Verrucomicrobiae bacterium]|nr:hypothetical protein [Verrucomicrobiae bacterium]